MTTAAVMTVEEFVNLETADTESYELVEGELVPMASGKPDRNFLRDDLGVDLSIYLKRTRLGRVAWETDCRIADDTVRRPDLGIYLGKHLDEIDRKIIPVPFAPDIAIEILSPSERTIDTNRKIREYLGAGSKEVWIVDQDNGEIFVHTTAGGRLLTAGDSLDTPLLPEFSASVADLLR